MSITAEEREARQARKTNERPGVRAVHRNAGMSATKARAVLDLIRGKSVAEARTILQFCDRGAAEVIVKVLDSAVANAGNNNDIPPEELFVTTAYADEGPTMKRWRPRARGRATRIRKRTCHITIVLSVIDAELLTVVQARRERAVSGRRATRGGGVADRRARVQASRTKRTDGGDDAVESVTVEEVTLEETTIEATAVENSAPEAEETN